MKAGGQKRKGNSFENELAKLLSSWLTSGERQDVLERSPASGGKATVHRKAGRDFGNIAGDLISVSKEGAALTNEFIIEAKHRASTGLESFIFDKPNKTGTMEWWDKLEDECDSHNKDPMLVIRQNRKPTIMILNDNGVYIFSCSDFVYANFPKYGMNFITLDSFLKNADSSILFMEEK